MGVFKFVRDEGAAKVTLASGRKGESLQPRKVIQFDSSPKMSICKQFGWSPSMFSLKETGRKGPVTFYDVFGGHEKVNSKPFKVGTLEYSDPLLDNSWR